MKGRKPTPTALKLITGNPGKRAINKKEPKAKVEVPRCPAHLTPEAKKHWSSIAKVLADAKVITKLDSKALELLCNAYARYIDANEKVAKHGMIIKSPSGYPVQSPYLSIANKAFEQVKVILTEFGMTPSSRSRIQVSEDGDKPSDPWNDI